MCKWCADHPQEALAIVTVIGTGTYEVFKICSKQYNIHQTQELKDKYIYYRWYHDQAKHNRKNVLLFCTCNSKNKEKDQQYGEHVDNSAPALRRT